LLDTLCVSFGKAYQVPITEATTPQAELLVKGITQIPTVAVVDWQYVAGYEDTNTF